MTCTKCWKCSNALCWSGFDLFGLYQKGTKHAGRRVLQTFFKQFCKRPNIMNLWILSTLYTLLVCHVVSIRGDHFVNEWAVEIPGGFRQARDVARSHGYEIVKEVSNCPAGLFINRQFFYFKKSWGVGAGGGSGHKLHYIQIHLIDTNLNFLFTRLVLFNINFFS